LKFGFFHGFPRFLRGGPTKRNLESQIFLRFLGILKDGLAQKFSKLELLRSFLRIFEGTDPPKKIVSPRTCPRFSWEFEGGQRKIAVFHFFAGVQFVLQLCHVFCSCAFFFADVLNLCIIPTYNFADVQMK
jgi:hypothetical protein